jgi:hypothetical protein
MHTVLTKNAELPFKGGLAFLLGKGGSYAKKRIAVFQII